MATIELFASTLLEDYEIAGPAEVTSRTTNCCGPTPEHYANLRVPIRRKPRLKQIVFTVAGEPQRLTHGDYYLDGGNTVARWLELEGSCSKYQRLHREEVYE